MGDSQRKLLLFGGSGQIGQAIARKFICQGWNVISISRQKSAAFGEEIQWNPNLDRDGNVPSLLLDKGPFDAVCWAQGVNLNDSIYGFDLPSHKKVYEANVLFILATLSSLIQSNLLSKPSRLCIISSIWQKIARQNKLSYAISKSALHGLVLSLVDDMAIDGHLINAVLPGALDTPMTRNNLSEKQIEIIEQATNFKRLPRLEEVANTTYFLCSDENTGVTGQFIKVDLGFSDVRNI